MFFIVKILTVFVLLTFIQTNPINLNDLNEQNKQQVSLTSDDYQIVNEQDETDGLREGEPGESQNSDDDQEQDQEENEYNLLNEASSNDQEVDLYEKILKSDANIPIVNINFSELTNQNKN